MEKFITDNILIFKFKKNKKKEKYFIDYTTAIKWFGKIIIILFLLKLFFTKKTFSLKYNEIQNKEGELLPLEENLNLSALKQEDHYKLLLPRKRRHSIPRKKPENQFDLFKLENSYDNKKMKESGQDSYIYYSCIIVKVKHENLYIREFIEYYINLGIEKFYMGDDNPENEENLSDVINDYIQQGIVDLEYIKERNLTHMQFFDYSFRNVKTRCKWFLFFDVDEYLEFTDTNMTLKTYLEMPVFNKCDVIRIHWKVFDDNDLIYYDNRSLKERFTHSSSYSKFKRFHKSIVRGKDYGDIVFSKSPHQPDKHIKDQCDALGNYESPGFGKLTKPKYDYCFIKHYRYKTAEEFAVKLLRGRHRSSKYDYDELLKGFFKVNQLSEEKIQVIEYILNRSFPKYHKRNY